MSNVFGEQPIANDSSTETSNDSQQVSLALQLVIMQIVMSLRESGNSVGRIADNITSLSSHLQQINRDIEEQAKGITALPACIQANGNIQQVIMDLQYYDRLSQRFSHIRKNLSEIISVLSAPGREHEAMWRNLQRRMRTVFSGEQEQAMYSALRAGQSLEGSGEAGGTSSRPGPNSDIELF